jgi:hypothetical protein
MVWDYNSVACPQMVVRLSEGLMKLYMNYQHTGMQYRSSGMQGWR